MSLVTIPPRPGDVAPEEWCRRLEAGDILFFPDSPVPIPAGDLEFLLGRRQSGSALHKNIAYKPDRDSLSGVDRGQAGPEAAAEIFRLHSILRRYSRDAAGFLASFLTPYEGRLRLDYASFRPLEEQGRDLPPRRRNDLLHTDAFPTRPTRGARILRFFNNIHPERSRDWVVGEPFEAIAKQFAPKQIALPRPNTALGRRVKSMAASAGLGRVFPALRRSPYDGFMMRFHNFLKENAAFQAECRKSSVRFPPGSSWLAYTDMVPHAVLAGQYALEQTFLVDHAAMVAPEHSPLSVLEAMAGRALT
jgi:hypothetical protein